MNTFLNYTVSCQYTLKYIYDICIPINVRHDFVNIKLHKSLVFYNLNLEVEKQDEWSIRKSQMLQFVTMSIL